MGNENKHSDGHVSKRRHESRGTGGLRETLGLTPAAARYHEAANTVDDDDLDSLGASISSIQVANNAVVALVSDKTRELHTALVATQQQLTMLMQASPRGSKHPSVEPESTRRGVQLRPLPALCPRPTQPVRSTGVCGTARAGPRSCLQ